MADSEKMKGDRDIKNWISQDPKELFRWINKHFS